MPQTVTNFTSHVTPVSIVLVLDVSSSIRPSLDGINAGAHLFFGGLREGDTVLNGFFNHDPWFTKDFTKDPVILAREIRVMRASGMTALYDAILASLEELSIYSKLSELCASTVSLSFPELGQYGESVQR